uniref:Uncharacterized protein n=1 Tax=Solanum lycopersicum TaxID=4081 RepID=A0A3Q7EJD6_SOLLC
MESSTYICSPSNFLPPPSTKRCTIKTIYTTPPINLICLAKHENELIESYLARRQADQVASAQAKLLKRNYQRNQFGNWFSNSHRMVQQLN